MIMRFEDSPSTSVDLKGKNTAIGKHAKTQAHTVSKNQFGHKAEHKKRRRNSFPFSFQKNFGLKRHLYSLTIVPLLFCVMINSRS